MKHFKLSTAALALIPVAIGINYVGKFFAGLLKLPLWLDSIGTVLASMLAGPVIGALAGLINNIIYGLTVDPISFIYAITSVVIGIVVGVMAYKGFLKDWKRVIIMGVVAGLAAAVVSTPLNVIFWGGQTGNIWGDALFAGVMASTNSVWLASFLDEIVVDIPDKLLTVILSFILFKSLPKSLIMLYKADDAIKELK